MNRGGWQATVYGVARVGHILVTKPPPLNVISLGFPGGTNGKESACQCRRPKRYRFDPWVGKIPRRKAWQPTPVILA